MGRGGLKAEFWCEGIFLWFSAGRNFGFLFFRFWLCGRRSMVLGYSAEFGYGSLS